MLNNIRSRAMKVPDRPTPALKKIYICYVGKQVMTNNSTTWHNIAGKLFGFSSLRSNLKSCFSNTENLPTVNNNRLLIWAYSLSE